MKLPLGLLENVCNDVLTMMCMSLLLLQCLPRVLRLAGLGFGPGSLQQPSLQGFVFILLATTWCSAMSVKICWVGSGTC